jgi:hypothetical protein
MKKLLLSLGLGLASLAGLAGAAEVRAAGPAPEAMPPAGVSVRAHEFVVVGPFVTYEEAYDEMLNLLAAGHRASLPFLGDDGYYYLYVEP